MARELREVGDEEASLEDIQSAALEYRDAKEARENAQLVLKAAKETESAKRDRLDILTGAKVEDRPLLDGGDGDE